MKLNGGTWDKSKQLMYFIVKMQIDNRTICVALCLHAKTDFPANKSSGCSLIKVLILPNACPVCQQHSAPKKF